MEKSDIRAINGLKIKQIKIEFRTMGSYLKTFNTIFGGAQVIKIATNKNSVPVNDKIIASEVMLIDEKGEKLGLIKLEDAIQKAKDKDLDLVQVSPKDANPTVCKLMDYGKHMFTKKKIMSSSKKR